MENTELISQQLADHFKGVASREYVESIVVSNVAIPPLEYQSTAKNWRSAEIEFSAAPINSVEEKAAKRKMIELMDSAGEIRRTKQLFNFKDPNDHEVILFIRRLQEIMSGS